MSSFLLAHRRTLIQQKRNILRFAYFSRFTFLFLLLRRDRQQTKLSMNRLLILSFSYEFTQRCSLLKSHNIHGKYLSLHIKQRSREAT